MVGYQNITIFIPLKLLQMSFADRKSVDNDIFGGEPTGNDILSWRNCK